MQSKNRNHYLRGFKKSEHLQILAQAVQLVITNHSFNTTQLLQQKIEILNVENIPQAQQIVKNIVSPLNLSEFPVARRLHFFLQNWDKLTSDPDRTIASYVQFQ